MQNIERCIERCITFFQYSYTAYVDKLLHENVVLFIFKVAQIFASEI